MTITPNRVPPGVPTGGQFAATAKAEADVSLSDEPWAPAEPTLSQPDRTPEVDEPTWNEIGNGWTGTRHNGHVLRVMPMPSGFRWVVIDPQPRSVGEGRAATVGEAQQQAFALAQSLATLDDWEIGADQRQEIVRQIGGGTIAAISGGRVKALRDGIEMPVSSGYKVRVRLAPDDTYTVQRVFVRGDKEFPKGERRAVYYDRVGESAYRASCFGSYDEDEW